MALDGGRVTLDQRDAIMRRDMVEHWDGCARERLATDSRSREQEESSHFEVESPTQRCSTVVGLIKWGKAEEYKPRELRISKVVELIGWSATWPLLV